ncbi:hypothetical protein [Flavobacterium beibuense]|uniref:hypothetical protein n=1 Tax=Flavobacterium beibuense TaxID=657326 RepID=UPI003A8EB0A7
MDIQLFANELQRYYVQNRKAIKLDFARATKVSVDAYCRKVTKIKGTYQILTSVMTHVVQGFKAEWQALGQLSVRDKELKNYHQKINIPIVPAEVLSTALADWYEEDVTITNKMICKVVIDWVMTQVVDDVELLSFIGEYDQAQASGAFGYSLNGWNKIIEAAVANVNRPVYKIPCDAITSENIYDVLLNFEMKFPKILKGKIKEIHLSTKNLELYEVAYQNKFNASPSYDEKKRTKSPLRNRGLVGWDNLDDDKIFATIDGNMLNLIDVIDNPGRFTDVQVQDYTVKLFGEFWKGYDFLINECVLVADFSGTVTGLGDNDLMKLYYPHETLEEVIP